MSAYITTKRLRPRQRTRKRLNHITSCMVFIEVIDIYTKVMGNSRMTVSLFSVYFKIKTDK